MNVLKQILENATRAEERLPVHSTIVVQMRAIAKAAKQYDAAGLAVPAEWRCLEVRGEMLAVPATSRPSATPRADDWRRKLAALRERWA